VHVVENGHLEAAGIAVHTSASGLHATGAGVEMEVAETLIAKSGRTAVDAVFLEMLAGTAGHGCLQNLGYQLSAISSQLGLNSELVQAARYAGSKSRTEFDWGSSPPRL
jgi:hypothetical protein